MLKIKAYAYAIGTALVAFGLAIMRIIFLKQSRNRYRESSKTYKAQLDQEVAINEAESEIGQEFSHRAEESKRDLKEGKMPANIRDRNGY